MLIIKFIYIIYDKTPIGKAKDVCKIHIQNAYTNHVYKIRIQNTYTKYVYKIRIQSMYAKYICKNITNKPEEI